MAEQACVRLERHAQLMASAGKGNRREEKCPEETGTCPSEQGGIMDGFPKGDCCTGGSPLYL